MARIDLPPAPKPYKPKLPGTDEITYTESPSIAAARRLAQQPASAGQPAATAPVPPRPTGAGWDPGTTGSYAINPPIKPVASAPVPVPGGAPTFPTTPAGAPPVPQNTPAGLPPPVNYGSGTVGGMSPGGTGGFDLTNSLDALGVGNMQSRPQAGGDRSNVLGVRIQPSMAALLKARVY